MKKKRSAEEQIIGSVKEHESGVRTEAVCRRPGISGGAFCSRRSKYAGLEVSEAGRLRELEKENARLKKIPAEKAAEVGAMRDAPSKKRQSLPAAGRLRPASGLLTA